MSAVIHTRGKVTTAALMKMKQEKQKITALTAYDYPFAAMVDTAGMDMILVGDSLGMVVQGKETTLPVTMDEMVYHTAMVARACSRTMVVGDMPFMSYQGALDQAVENGGRLLKQGGAAAVKLEGGADVCPVISALARAGVPVQAHIGLTPQSVHQMGGFRVQRDEDRLLKDAEAVQAAGAFSVVLEGIPSAIAKKITQKLTIPTIGIGAGPDCDGQILVLHDMLGITDRPVPKFVKKYADIAGEAKQGLNAYIDEVRAGTFPSEAYEYK
jgi:3-methyl-2-oxobutanoate hydroxymethyltransferase